VTASGRSQLLTSTASRIRPSGQADSGTPASARRSRVVCTSPLFTASYTAPCPRRHSNRYVLTPDGIKMAVFYTKVHNRLLRPLMAASQPQAPPELRQALRTIDQHVGDYITRARLGKAA
jgi:hypothetical protein